MMKYHWFRDWYNFIFCVRRVGYMPFKGDNLTICEKHNNWDACLHFPSRTLPVNSYIHPKFSPFLDRYTIYLDNQYLVLTSLHTLESCTSLSLCVVYSLTLLCMYVSYYAFLIQIFFAHLSWRITFGLIFKWIFN